MTRWTEHVKAYAAKHGISYKDAISASDCKDEYKELKPKSDLTNERQALNDIKKYTQQFESTLAEKERMLKGSKSKNDLTRDRKTLADIKKYTQRIEETLSKKEHLLNQIN